MTTIKAQPHQTLFDLALQAYGDVRGVYWLVEDNGLYGILDSMQAGQELQVRDTALNTRMRDYLKPYTIATAENAEAQGIGFWRTNEYIIE